MFEEIINRRSGNCRLHHTPRRGLLECGGAVVGLTRQGGRIVIDEPKYNNDDATSTMVDVTPCHHLTHEIPLVTGGELIGDKLMCTQCVYEAEGRLPPPMGRNNDLVKIDIEPASSVRDLVTTLGVEIEVAFDSRTPFTPDGYHEYHGLGEPWLSSWRGEYDRSIEDVGGIEFISPILTSSGYALGALVHMIKTIDKHGGTRSRETGVHIHLGKNGVSRHHIVKQVAVYEEFMYAAAGSLWRYRRGRYSPPIKKREHSGHYIALNTTYRTHEVRLFSGSVSILGILVRAAIASGLYYLAKNDILPQYVPSRQTLLPDATMKEYASWVDLLGWYEGGPWKGWMYDPNTPPTVSTVAANGNKYTYTLPSATAIVAYIDRYVKRFVAAGVGETIEDALGEDDF